MLSKIAKYSGIALILFIVVAQAIRPEKTNPPTAPDRTFETIAKPGPDAAAIVRRACGDCHSNSTVWPWYSGVAPVSWLVTDDVKDGRAHLNFSEWGFFSPDMANKRLQEVCSEVKAGEMPPWYYLLMHPEARISDKDVQVLCNLAGKTAEVAHR